MLHVHRPRAAWGTHWLPRAVGAHPSATVQCNDWPYFTAHSSCRYGHAILPPRQTDNSKDDYFPSLSSLPLSLSFSTPTPWHSDSVLLWPSLYQQACCNMNKANTWYSAGSSYCECRWDFSQFSIRRSGALSRACCYVISQGRHIAVRDTDHNTIQRLLKFGRVYQSVWTFTRVAHRAIIERSWLARSLTRHV